MLPLIFILGYLAIVFEHPLKLNKAASALLVGVLCWTYMMLSHGDTEGVQKELRHVLASSSEIVFFLLGALTIVELIDAHNGFDLITNMIQTKNEKKLVWIISLTTFVLAAVLDTMATAVVMVKLVDKLIKGTEKKVLLSGFVVVAANAGGSWSVIGAPTTTMLWIGNQVSVGTTFFKLILPCLLSLVVTLLLFQRKFEGQPDPKKAGTEGGHRQKSEVTRAEKIMFFSGIALLLFVPIFKTWTHLPPYVGMMLSLGILWVISEVIHSKRDEEDKKRYSVGYALSKIEMPSILFFLGILLAVGSLEVSGDLKLLAQGIEKVVPNQTITASIIGLLSAIVDNIPLTAAAQGMYPISTYPTDDKLWLLLAYCVGTGGSILVIGSAAGVAVMGLHQEKMTFGWYVKNISLWALISYVIGILIFVLFN